MSTILNKWLLPFVHSQTKDSFLANIRYNRATLHADLAMANFGNQNRLNSAFDKHLMDSAKVQDVWGKHRTIKIDKQRII